MTAVSYFAAHPYLNLYLKGILNIISYIFKINEAFLDIPSNLLSPSSMSTQINGLKHHCVSALNTESTGAKIMLVMAFPITNICTINMLRSAT